MSLKRLASSQLTPDEIEEIFLPEEVWILIWSYLDFETVQKICTRVSNSWLEMIRRSKMSWEMKLRHSYHNKLEVKDFNSLLFHWNNLRELHFSSGSDFTKFRLSLNSHKELKKVVVPSAIAFYRIFRKGSKFSRKLWGKVTKYWIDPSHLSTPSDIVKNVIQLRINPINLPEEFAMMQKDCDLTNLESLIICPGIPFRQIVPMLSKFEKLKKLEICDLLIFIEYLLDILRCLGNMKTLKMSVTLRVMSDFDDEATKAIFNQAIEILNEKFPFPDVRILDLKISESWILLDYRPIFSIEYGENGTALEKIE